MIDIKQQQKISQTQQLSSQQLQSLSLLSVPVLELQEKINEAMNSNPVLEYENFSDNALFRELPDASFEDEKKMTSGDDEADAYGSNTDDAWHDDLPLPSEMQEYSSEQLQKREYFFSNITEEQSMQQQLMQELSYLDFSGGELEVAEAIVGAVDENGFISTPLADIAQSTNAELAEVEEILFRLQKIFPPGIGARDLKESLKLQLEASGENTPELLLVIDNLEDFGANRLDLLAKKLSMPVEKIRELGEKIRKLNPHPGNVLNVSKVSFVVPEATVVYDGEKYILQEHDEFLPKIKISEEYRKMLEKDDLSPDVRTYLRKKMQEAELFRTSLEMREKTVIRIARFITGKQQEFFAGGPEFLRPMSMMQAAEALDIHETTVSRGCANKYLATPQGLFEFKFFFSGGFANADGKEISVHGIQEKIREYIENEDESKPFSDEKISVLLKADGFSVARRTVAKYREQMNILPTNLRRKR